MLSSRLRIHLNAYTLAAVLRVGMVVKVLLLWVREVEGSFDGYPRVCIYEDWDGVSVEDDEIVIVDVNISLLLDNLLFVYAQQIQF